MCVVISLTKSKIRYIILLVIYSYKITNGGFSMAEKVKIVQFSYKGKDGMYVSEFKGREDVIAFFPPKGSGNKNEDGNRTKYVRAVNKEITEVYNAELSKSRGTPVWIAGRDYYLEPIYDILRKKGVRIRNDFFLRENSLLDVVKKKIRELKVKN